jgi:pimeloyl-ACP methyl ester carboxylesterase
MNSMQALVMPGAEADVTLSVTIDDAATGGSVEEREIALIAHGAGSSADFVRRAFGPPLAAGGFRLASYDLRAHGDSSRIHDPDRLQLRQHAADLAVLAERLGARLLGGISLGAHAAVRAALSVQAALMARTAPRSAEPDRLVGLLLVMPAWTGDPDAVAAANAVQAAELAAVGTSAVLRRIGEDHPGWVADELAAAWPRHDPESFVAALRGLARSAAPAVDELARIEVPVGVVALRDDPMHPATVAHRWAEALPRAVLAEVEFAAPATDRSVLGAAAVTAWRRAAR